MLVDGHGKAYQALGRCGGSFETIKWWTASRYIVPVTREYILLYNHLNVPACLLTAAFPICVADFFPRGDGCVKA